MTHEKETQSVLFTPMSLEFHVVVQLLSCVCLFVTPCTAAWQASLSFTISQILLKLMSVELMMAWCHPTISSSVLPSSSCLKSFPVAGSFPVSRLFASGGQSTGASASVSVLPMNIQGWFPLWLTDLISLQSKGLSSVFSSITIWKHQFFGTQPSLWSILTSVYDSWKNKNHSFVGKVTFLLFTMLSKIFRRWWNFPSFLYQFGSVQLLLLSLFSSNKSIAETIFVFTFCHFGFHLWNL